MNEDLLEQVESLPLLFGGSFRPPASEPQLCEAEARCLLALPAELRRMLQRFDGMTGPTDLHHGWITLWGTEELELPNGTAGYEGLSGLWVFADHGLNSWWYAIERGHADERPSRVYMLAFEEPRIIAGSLGEFLRAMLADDPLLYGGANS